MRSNKSQRQNLPHRGRSSQGSQPPLGHPPISNEQHASTARAVEQDLGEPAKDLSQAREPGPEMLAITNSETGEGLGDVEELRKRMEMVLAHKQTHQTSASASTESPTSLELAGGIALRRSLASGTNSSSDTIAAAPLSTDSARTIKGNLEMTPGAIRTPSYPFPRMNLRLNRESSHRSAPSHKPFTLLSPTNTPSQVIEGTSAATDDPASSGVSTPAAHHAGDDPNFPTPDLYDMILMLSAEPGLEAWWANVTQIMAEAYCAERASLAIPGDMTDLENVPWGQKATFNVYGADSFGSSIHDSGVTSEPDSGAANRILEEPDTAIGPLPTTRRPVLESRHSIAGVLPDPALKGARQRPHGPVRAKSNIYGHDSDIAGPTPSPRALKQLLKARSSFLSESQSSGGRNKQGSSESATSVVRAIVHRTLQALEVEPDSLMVRTGIPSMFGKRKPVVLTRAYADDSSNPDLSSQSHRRNTSLKGSAIRHVGAKSSERFDERERGRAGEAGRGTKSLRTYDEYEQHEPSPWSQSPAPSPAARPDPSESPFFIQTAGIDETAFEPNPPAFDYAATANHSFAAIGADSSKTLIHIPLIQPVPSRGILSSSLRFPIAILSFLSPTNPYPRNLRHSLNDLLPHLASSYSLAQQYSNLQSRLTGPLSGHRGTGFGLGGTFSDESSELELVAELSGHLAQGTGRDSRSSRHSSVHNPTERLMAYQENSASAPGSPFFDHFGFSPGVPSTPGRSGSEMVDSYFSAKRQKNLPPQQAAVTPGGRGLSEDSPERARTSKQKSAASSRGPVKKGAIPARKQNEQTPPSAANRASGTFVTEHGEAQRSDWNEKLESNMQRHQSSQGIQSREAPDRKLPELISQLMLNSVPLQLFLAKPKTGELVWTNSKFDAFRSQGEGRVKDPWQNVHMSDHEDLLKGWNNTLKTGSQFTHYIRVKRFNSDNDYRWFIFRASPLLSQNGQLLYWIGSFLDVHDQYMAEIQAAEEKELFVRDAKYRALANSIPQILFEAIEDEGIVSANEQWHIFSGQSLEDALNLGFAKHVHRDDLQKCGLLSPAARRTQQPQVSKETTSNSSDSSNMTVHATQLKVSEPVNLERLSTSASLETLVKNGTIKVEQDENGRVSYTTELRLRSKGGEFRWFLVRLVKVESDFLNKGRASWYGTCTDINDRKALERELNRVNQKIQQEMESKTKFFANMSHEIRTPLNGILGSIPWLVESSLDHDQRRTLDTIQNSSNNLRELVDNILDVTKVEAGKMTLVYKWFHIRTLLEEVIDTIASRAIDKGLELNYTVDSNVPSNVGGDPFRLRQVLINLIGNAVKFTEQGEVYTRCSISEPPHQPIAEPNVMYLAFEVIDTGRGFDDAGFKRLFKQFGQIDGSSSHDAGSGLGLFLSKQLVEMHGGHLTATGQPEQGATFGFYIRVEVVPSGENVKSPPPPKPNRNRSSQSDLGSPRSRSDSKTPTMNMEKGVVQSPGFSKYVASPDVYSPPLASSGSSDPSIRSASGHQTDASSLSSLLPTPESGVYGQTVPLISEQHVVAASAIVPSPVIKRSRSENSSGNESTQPKHPTMYSIVVICPAQYARAAIKQHIGQVVPHQIVVNVTTIDDIGTFRELMHGPTSPTFTHIVLDLPASADVMLFMRQMSTFTATVIPTLVVITDHYQKRDILEDFATLLKAGRKGYLVHKPVKPSVFALIFDPAQLRILSKDRTRDMAQSVTENFKNVSERVKKAIGGKGFRVLLVEDSDVNRLVILKYLKKVDLASETATNGLECTEKVTSKPAGYYSLIICDIQMPIKNGYEACSELRQWEAGSGYRPMPIMALTANAMPEERAAAAYAGFTDYLTKPVDFNTLGTMMISLLDSNTPHIFLRDRPVS